MLLALSLAAATALTPASSTERFVIKSTNMSPRLEVNQRVEFDLAAYANQEPKVGDIVLLHPPVGAAEERCGNRPKPRAACTKPYGGPDTSVRFVDRVVAVGGDRISFRRGRVVRNGTLETRKLVRSCSDVDACSFPRTITVPEGHVYVAGDNRGGSDDSRFWGALPIDQVLGRYVRTAGTCGC
ncbi:signal peptidase I [Solirubrobacter pauli]|uniref:Signal peptidase I n=1 Tax=Solirubrobacter pauli TaxID=166793 RepID=A0A660L5R7_9ACTN|nr:signal peptidase I [Solirubrobacter pauli]RKQ90327.1 signal peptidase I [Solirubrobacter pauli]